MASNSTRATNERDLLDLLEDFEVMMQGMITAGVTYHSFKEHIERLYVNAAVRMSDGNYCAAARKIGLHRNNVSRIMGRVKVRQYEQASRRSVEVSPNGK